MLLLLLRRCRIEEKEERKRVSPTQRGNVSVVAQCSRQAVSRLLLFSRLDPALCDEQEKVEGKAGEKESRVDVGSVSLKEEGGKYGGVSGATTEWKREGKGYSNMAPQAGGCSCTLGKENKKKGGVMKAC